ncbi:TRAP transporter large permease [Rhodoligotrophos defluvii]|uniref:TRAP transporter large permease n=1 Tax=Rhodoligotrophos defluvii TaxID=2561934 RepID=UPI0010C9DDCC|nr:TRAP transporter large permease [Rhodoligotrophos defluvii]
MTNLDIGLSGLGVLVAMIALRVPIGVALLSVSFVGIWLVAGDRAAWGLLRGIPYSFAANWTLSSVPMFLLMGFICYHAGITKGLFNAARLWLSRLPGGLAVSAVFGAAGFAAVTGSSVACAAAMGRIAVPEMIRYRYDPALATGTVAAAGTIGALIPPSILLIIYGLFAQTPISHLFVGGFSAGILTLLGYVLVIMVRAKLNPALAPPLEERPSFREKVYVLRDVWPVALLIIGVFGGLLSGLFTATEAGGVGAALAIIIGLARRSLSYAGIKNSVVETIVTSAAIFFISIGASMLTRFLAFSGVGAFLTDLIVGLGLDHFLLMLGISILYLLLGMFLEPIGAMLLTLPVVLPIIQAADLNLIWFGVVLVKFLEIGMITPPIGLNVFVIKGVVGNLASTTNIFRGIMWFLCADLVIIVILMVFPDIILFLPSLLNR